MALRAAASPDARALRCVSLSNGTTPGFTVTVNATGGVMGFFCSAQVRQ